jgi:hypothetical protein
MLSFSWNHSMQVEEDVNRLLADEKGEGDAGGVTKAQAAVLATEASESAGRALGSSSKALAEASKALKEAQKAVADVAELRREAEQLAATVEAAKAEMASMQGDVQGVAVSFRRFLWRPGVHEQRGAAATEHPSHILTSRLPMLPPCMQDAMSTKVQEQGASMQKISDDLQARLTAFSDELTSMRAAREFLNSPSKKARDAAELSPADSAGSGGEAASAILLEIQAMAVGLGEVVARQAAHERSVRRRMGTQRLWSSLGPLGLR